MKNEIIERNRYFQNFPISLSFKNELKEIMRKFKKILGKKILKNNAITVEIKLMNTKEENNLNIIQIF